MNILKNTSSRLLYTLLLISIVVIFTSCFGFSEQDPSIPNVSSVAITGDTAADLAILVSWTASDNSGGYNIYRSEDGVSFDYTGSTGPAQLSYIDADEDLVLGNTYTYKISSYDIWHALESTRSSASTGIDFFLAPVWESIFSQTTGSPVKIKVANSPANLLYFVYADNTGLLHVGRIIEEEDPDDEDETIFTTELLEEDSFSPRVNSVNPDFDIIYANNALYIGFADADESDQLTVMEITTDTDDDDLLTWEFANFGTSGFSDNPVTSISLTASTEIFSDSILYAGHISNITGSDDQLSVWSRPIDVSSGIGWRNISPLHSPEDTIISGIPEQVKIFLDGSNISASYNNGALTSSLDIISRSNEDGEWYLYDSSLPTFTPNDEHFSTGTAGNLLSVLSVKTNNTWNIQTRDNDGWIIQDNDLGFDTVSSGLTFPFSSAITASNMYLMANTTSGPEVLMYERELEDVGKWFSYGNPGGTDSIESPQLVVSTGAGTENYYAAWIEGSTAHISIGR
jgi:hypothetical protein